MPGRRREIGLVTVGRSDFGIYTPLLRAIEADPRLELRLIVGGAHLRDEFGRTEEQIAAAGFAAFRRLDYVEHSDTPHGTARSIAAGVRAFGDLFAEWRPDILVVLGDRFDMLPAPVAALPYRIPVAHLHGGEVTEGAFDDAIRHAITKLSHLHFVTTETHGRRLRQMGEEAWRIAVSGAPGLDTLIGARPAPREATVRMLGLEPAGPLLLVTYHSVTLEPDLGAAGAHAVARALRDIDANVVVTAPNADPGHETVRAVLHDLVEARPQRARWIENAGAGYIDLLAAADAMVGNSSSGIIEAAAVGLPVVNVGTRQQGRERAESVIDVVAETDAIRAGIDRALSPEFRGLAATVPSPYGDGRASERIVERLATVGLGSELMLKRFVDLPPETAARSLEARA